MLRPSPAPARLYCFPYAGATSSIYRAWQARETPGIQIVGVDPPGRGTRAREPREKDFDAIVELAACYICADLARARADNPGLRYATFGHSFGAFVSLCVAVAVARKVGQNPVRGFISAAPPPRMQQSQIAELDRLTDGELLEKIREDGGTDPQLLASGAMAGYIVRIMREDFAIRRQFIRHAGLRADFPLTLVAARDDVHVSREQMWQWAEHSTASCRRIQIPGGHFAAFHEPERILAVVREGLCADTAVASTGLTSRRMGH